MTQFHSLDSGADKETRIFSSAFYRNTLSYGIITTSSWVPGWIYESSFPLAYTRATRKVNPIIIFVVFCFSEVLVICVEILSTFYLSTYLWLLVQKRYFVYIYFVGTFIFNLSANFHTPRWQVFNPMTQENIRTAGMLISYLLQKKITSQSCIIFVDLLFYVILGH